MSSLAPPAPPTAPPWAGVGTPVRLALLGVVAAAAVEIGFVTTSFTDAGHLVQNYGYYTIAATFAWFVATLVRVTPAAWRVLPPLARREGWQLAALVAGCTLVAVLTTPYDYKVLYDEPVIQGTAWNLHFFREVGNYQHAYMVNGVFSPITAAGTYLDKRPFFFAYLVSLLHDLTGYRTANAFALNTALMPVVLGLAYFYARRLVAHAAALAAVFTLGTLSLVAQNATGAGMELLNLAMILLTLHLVAHWLAAPDAPRLSAVVLAVVLLAQTRYESALYVAPVALAVFEGWRRAGRLILPAAAVLGPALLLPYALHSTYLSGTPFLWELRDNDTGRFGLQYFSKNIVHAWRFFSDTSGLATASSWWLFGAGFVALALILVRLVRALPQWRAAPPAAVALTIGGSGIAANLLLLQFYYWGQLDDAIVGRLSLPFATLLVLCLALVVQRWSSPRLPLVSVVAGGAVLAAFTSGLIANARHSYRNILAQELAWESRFVAARPPGDRLILTGRSALVWYAQHIASVPITRATIRARAVQFHLAQHTFSEVLVIQNYRPVGPDGGFQLDPNHRLPESYVLEPLAERRFGAQLARISRVVAINLPPETDRAVMETVPPAGATVAANP
ncbi:MAG: hypothetical protein WCL04_07845 [Verrucomicrobiota bacterium]